MEPTKVVPIPRFELTPRQKMVFTQLGPVYRAIDGYSKANNINGIWSLGLVGEEWKLTCFRKMSKKSHHKLKTKNKPIIRIRYAVKWNTDDVNNGCKVVKLKGK